MLAQARGELGLACEFFFSLAAVGGIPVAFSNTLSSFKYRSPIRIFVDATLEQVYAECECEPLEPLSVGILVNLVERLVPSTKLLRIDLPFNTEDISFVPGIYPFRNSDWAFEVKDATQDRNLEIRIDFFEDVGESERIRIEGALGDWWTTAALGAFREADQSVDDSSLIPPRSVDWDSNSIEFTVEKLHASDAVVDSLFGVVTWMHRDVAAVACINLI
jgi:hypothetical protein